MNLPKKTQKLLSKAKQAEQIDVTWECALRKMHSWVQGRKKNDLPNRPHMIFTVDAGRDLIVTANVSQERPDAGQVLDAVLTGIVDMSPGNMVQAQKLRVPSIRPATLLVNDEAIASAIAPVLAEIGVAVHFAAGLYNNDLIFQTMSADLNPKGPPAITRVDGMTDALALETFSAADAFFVAELWQGLFNEDIIEVKFGNEPTWYCSVMGNGGEQFGIAFYPSLDDLNETLSGKHPSKIKQSNPWISATFDEAFVASFDDLDFMEKHGLSVTDEDAYLGMFAIRLPSTILPLTLSQSQMVAACLRTFPQFVTSHMLALDEDEPKAASTTFPLSQVYGGQTIALSYPVEGVVADDENFLATADGMDWDDDEEDSDMPGGPGGLAMNPMLQEMAAMADEIEPGAGKLMLAINSVQPPVRFSVSKDVLKSLKPKPKGMKADEWYEPAGAVYAGEAAGILVMLMSETADQPLVCPITELQVEPSHPLAAAIREYTRLRADS